MIAPVRKLIIEEMTKPKGVPQTSAKAERFDLQDAFLTLGFGSLEAGVAWIYWPAALILAGLLFFGFAFLIERARAKEAKIGTAQS